MGAVMGISLLASPAFAACSTVPFLRSMEAAVGQLALADSPATVSDAAAQLQAALTKAERHAHEIVDRTGWFRDAIDSGHQIAAEARLGDRRSIARRLQGGEFHLLVRIAHRKSGDCDYAEERTEDYRAPPANELIANNSLGTRSPAHGEIKKRGGDRSNVSDTDAQLREEEDARTFAKNMRFIFWISAAIGLAALLHRLGFLRRRRRRSRRFACCADATLSWDGKAEQVVIVDISRRGARVRSDADVYRGDAVKIAVFTHEISAVVAWRGQISFGLKFEKRLARSIFMAIRRVAATKGGIAEIA